MREKNEVNAYKERMLSSLFMLESYHDIQLDINNTMWQNFGSQANETSATSEFSGVVIVKLFMHLCHKKSMRNSVGNAFTVMSLAPLRNSVGNAFTVMSLAPLRNSQFGKCKDVELTALLTKKMANWSKCKEHMRCPTQHTPGALESTPPQVPPTHDQRM